MAAKPTSAARLAAQQPASILDSLVGYRLRRASNRMLSDFSATMAPLALRPVLFAMLEVVRGNPGIIQMGLGTELGIQRANLVPLINELAARDLIERRAAPHDRRAMALFLTPAGEVLLEQADAMVREHEERMLAGLTRGERDKLLELLAKIAAD
ncbi:MAG: MarR family transcriptional regulator [Alphaproteobacteria bacterium]|nr:MarR family transcriptional regulator [Alphaproteobacteria bacterium]